MLIHTLPRIVKPPAWDFNKHRVKRSARWVWGRQPLLSLPLWDGGQDLSAGSGLLNLATMERINTTLLDNAPVWEETMHGTGLLFDASSNTGIGFGSSELGMDMTLPWTLEAFVSYDTYGGGSDLYPIICTLAAGDQINSGQSMILFFSNGGAYDGICFGWPSGPKGDTVDAGLAGADIDGNVWTHLLLRFNGGATDTLSNYDVRVEVTGEGGEIIIAAATYAFVNIGGLATSSILNRIGTDSANRDWDGDISFLNWYQEFFDDGDCDRRFADKFGMFQRESFFGDAVTGAFSITPDAVVGAWSVADPIVAVGAVALTPDAVVGAWSVAAPVVAIGAVGIAPDAIPAAWTVAVPVVATGAVGLTPDAATAAWSIAVPVVDGGGTIALTPDAVAAVWTIAAPAVAVGALNIAPDAVVGAWSIAVPSVAAGVFALTPDPITGAWTVADPVVNVGVLNLTPVAVIANWIIATPSVIGGEPSIGGRVVYIVNVADITSVI